MWICRIRRKPVRERRMAGVLHIGVRLLHVCSFNESGQCESLNEWNGQRCGFIAFLYNIHADTEALGKKNKSI